MKSVQSLNILHLNLLNLGPLYTTPDGEPFCSQMFKSVYVPVKSKLQQPHPGNPRAFEFLEKFCSNPPFQGRKAV